MLSQVEQVSEFLKNTYGVEVEIDDFPEKEGVEIGALSHKTILVNKKSRGDIEILFVIAHLFGHMVQFTTYEKYRPLVEEAEKPKPLNLSEDFKKDFYKYEVEGYRYGKRLLEEVLGQENADELDTKFQVYLDTDFETFWEYLTTGHQISIDEFNHLLSQNYTKWSDKYPDKLQSVELPKKVEPKKDVVVY